MGYACPVCETPQRDGKHLANHLAFTAMLRHEEHEAWLDERVEGWSSLNPPELAEAVVPHAEETEYDEVFEDTLEGHDHGREHDHSMPGGVAAATGAGQLDAEAQQILTEARELTRRMMADDVGDSPGDEDVDAESTDE
jgi:hypothetical protein